MDMAELAAMMEKKYGIKKPEAVETPKPETKAITKTKPNKHENMFMLDLMVLRNTLATRMTYVRERLEQVNPHAWRDLRLMYSLVRRIQSQMLDTMPDSRLEYYAALARNGRYHLDIEGPVRQGRMVLISDINLARLCEAVMESECIMCLKTGEEVSKCPIRQILLEVSPPSAVLEYRCEYADAARELVRGEEVRI